MQLEQILLSNHFEETEEICPGCQNHCQVHCYHFTNGENYYSGNNCERIYSNKSEEVSRGINMMEEMIHFAIKNLPSKNLHPFYYKKAQFKTKTLPADEILPKGPIFKN